MREVHMVRAFWLSAMALLIAVVLTTAPFHAQGRGAGGGGQAAGSGSIADRTASMQKIDGYFPLYWDERAGTLWLEIPRFDAPFLMATGLAAGLGSNDIGLDRGAESGGGRIVSFRRVGPKVFLEQPNESF